MPSGCLVAGILLAAGESRRFGSASGGKQLALFRGTPLLRHSAQMLIDAGLQPRIAVLNGQDAATEQRHRAALIGLDVQIAVNPSPVTGMSGSIRVGLAAALEAAIELAIDAAAPAEPAAVVLTVCDQPFCTPDHLRVLAASAAHPDLDIVASGYSNVAGVPAYFSRRIFSALAQLEGDRGAGDLIRNSAARRHVIPFPAGAIDINTIADLQRTVSP